MRLSENQAILSRRHMLFGGLGAMALAASGCAAAPEKAASKLLGDWPTGIQLWAVNDQLKTDFVGTLKGLKAAGYDVVETAGLHGRTPAEFRKIVEDQGLKILSAHMSMGDLIDAPDRSVDDIAALGATWLYASAPKPLQPMPPGDWVMGMITSMNREAWLYNAEQIAIITPKAIKAGLIFGYHNHPMEFTDHGGQNGLDILLTGSEDLRLQLDIGWVVAAGLDPLVTMKKYATRTDMLHVKDMVRDTAIPSGFRSVDVGTGLVDWPSVFKLARELKLKGYIVDQEPPFPSPPLTSLANSLTYMKSL